MYYFFKARLFLNFHYRGRVGWGGVCLAPFTVPVLSDQKSRSSTNDESIDGKVMLAVFQNGILPWCREHGLKLLIMDNDPKLHSKSVVTFMKDNGVQIYPGGGKNPWVI